MGNKNTVYLTQEGLDELKKELDNLINVRRPENIQAIKEARALGDLSENAEYDAARNEQAQVEGRIKELEILLEKAELIEKKDNETVGLGSTVKIKYDGDDDDVEEYRIVGSKEADPSNYKISNESPLAKGIMGARLGEVCTVESPNGNYTVEIMEIK